MKKNTIINSLFWKFLERGGSQGITFVISLILARILSPTHYGIIAFLTIFIAISQVFVQGGLNIALVQKKNVSEKDISTVFYLCLIIAGVFYTILFFSAPLIEAFYGMGGITILLRVLSLGLFFGAFNSIQTVILTRNMQFRKMLYCSFSAVIISGIIGVFLALKGYGVWAIVAQQLSNQVVICIVMWIVVRWKPQLVFSRDSAKGLLSFGWKILVAGLIDALYGNLRNFIIGKKYAPEMLAFYNRGQQIPLFLIGNIDGSIMSVMLPAFSAYQDNRLILKKMVRRSLRTSAFLIFPLMTGLAMMAEPIVELLLTEKWLPCVPFLQISCLIFALRPIHTANLQAINALGRSDIFLRLEIIKKIVGLVILGIAVFCFKTVTAIVWSEAYFSVIALFINAFPNKKLLDYGYLELIKDVLPFVILSLFMGIAIWSISIANMSIWSLAIVQFSVGVSTYFLIAWLFKIESFSYIVRTIQDYRNNGTKQN